MTNFANIKLDFNEGQLTTLFHDRPERALMIGAAAAESYEAQVMRETVKRFNQHDELVRLLADAKRMAEFGDINEDMEDDGIGWKQWYLDVTAALEGKSATPTAEDISGEKVYVWVANYEHKHGNDLGVYATEAACIAARNALADTYWSDAFGDKEKPINYADEYFEHMEDMGSASEYFSYNEYEVIS